MPARVDETDYPEGLKRTTRSTPYQPPVVQMAYPQETGPQETVQQDERERVLRTAEALLTQVASDLGVSGDAPAYGGRLRDLAQSTGAAAPDLYDALIDAWKATRRKIGQKALTRPDAALVERQQPFCTFRWAESTIEGDSA